MELTSGKFDAAHIAQYGDTNPTFEDIYNNSSWWQRTGRLRDQALIDSGYSHWEGSADATAEELAKLGYKSQAELGGTSADGYNTYYKANDPTPTAPSAPSAPTGGGFSIPKDVPPPPTPAPEPFRMTSETGSAIGGDITATLGSVGKSPYDTAAKGLKGLTTPTGKAPVARDKEIERKKFGQGLFKVGVNLPGSGTGVQV